MIVNDFDPIPRFYGLAYQKWECRKAVCYLIPFNVIVRVLVNIWWVLKRGLFPSWYEQRLNQIDKDAWRGGYDVGLRTKYSEFKSELSIMEDLLKRILGNQE